MGHQQKGKNKKRKPGWHTRGSGPDYAWRNATKKIDRALKNWSKEKDNPGENHDDHAQ